MSHQTLLERIEAVQVTVEAMKSDLGPYPKISLQIARELQDELNKLKILANAAPAVYLALKDVMDTANSGDVMAWKKAEQDAKEAIAAVEGRM